MHWWIANLYNTGQIAQLVSWIFWVILSITLHELAHGWTAMWQGDTTPRDTGHLSLNPLVHMGPWSLLAFALIGIAWGLMPVNPARFRNGRRGRLYVSAAGPAMNILLFIISATGLGLWWAFGPQGTDIARNVGVFFWVGGTLNLVLAVFNMIPLPPLDGSTVLASLSFRMYNLMNNPQFQMFGMFVVLALMFAGAFDLLFHLSYWTTEQWGDQVMRMLT